MRKLVLTIFTTLIISLLVLEIPSVIYAEDSSASSTTTQTTQEQTDTSTSQDSSESSTDDQSNTQTESFHFSLGTILIAVITPLLLIIVCYLIIKTMKI
jgi:lipopolysaccharide/colanic/teichoic acid biosynthesis glycosyltransferase